MWKGTMVNKLKVEKSYIALNAYNHEKKMKDIAFTLKNYNLWNIICKAFGSQIQK